MSITKEASKSRAETGLQCLHSSVVEADQIDQLGHMNVRFYGARALSGARTLAGQVGMTDPEPRDDGACLAFTDLYTRHYREQLVGAPLEVWGGVLEVRETELRIYNELVNPEREELAATFVHVMGLQDRETHAPIPLTPEVMKSAEDGIVAWPEHGRPRSVDLDGEAPQLSLADVRARGLESRRSRLIREDECDSDGVYRTDSFLELVWGGERPDGSDDGDWLRELADGRKMGWATMESRGSLAELPRVGARIQSFGAEVALGRKTRHERFWVFDVDRETLLCTASMLNVAFDLEARKAMEIPADERARLKQRFHPDLL